MKSASPDLEFRCRAPARWLPRALAAAVLVAAMLGAFRIDPDIASLARYVRHFVVLVGALMALAIVRAGAELRYRVGLTRDGLVFRGGARRSFLAYRDIVRVDWAAPFSGTRHWLPALSLLDGDGAAWRVSALIEHGEQLVDEMLRRAGRHDLEAWAETHHVAARMARGAVRVALGYGVAAVTLLAGVMYYWR